MARASSAIAAGQFIPASELASDAVVDGDAPEPFGSAVVAMSSDSDKRETSFRNHRFKDDAPLLPAPSLRFITCGVHDAGLDGYRDEHLRAGFNAFLEVDVPRESLVTCRCKEVP